MVKNPPASAGDAGDTGSVPRLGRSPGAGNGNPLQYSCQGNPTDQRSLEGYSPWGCKESAMTERPSTHFEGLCSIQARVRSLGRVHKNNLGLSLYQFS